MMLRMIAAVVTVALLVSVGRAVAQERSHGEQPKKPTQGHMEVPHDAYVPADRAARRTTPAMRWSRDGTFSVQVNVDENGDNIVGDAANEPSLAVDPSNPDRMVIGWRQFDTISSDFRQAGWAYTADGGMSWTFPGVIEPGVFRSDPVVDADNDGVFYYNSLTANHVSSTDFQCKVFRSTDGGATWDAGTYAFGGDKQWQVIDKSGGMGDGNIYAFWTRFFTCEGPGCDGNFTRSYDGGQSFRNCIDVPGLPQWGTLAVDSNGTLYVAGDGFTFARSSNVKSPLGTPTWDVSTTVSLDGSMAISGGPNPGGLLGQVWIDVDTSGGPLHGNVYMLCSVNRSSTPDPLDVMFARSTDGGLTWSTPVRVNDDPGTSAYQWFGTMSVAPTGRIDVVWLDTRNDPGGYDSELYYSYSEDGGVTWAPNQALSPAFDPHVGWPQQQKMGDYFDMTSDADGAHLAYAATFNGEEDVYYARITRTLSISLPGGPPAMVPPGEPTTLTVRIDSGVEDYVDGSGTFHYRLADGPFQTAALVPLGEKLYQATLPAALCDDAPEFYFSAEGDQSGIVYLPPNAPAATLSVAVGEIAAYYSEPLDDNPGWATQGQWQFGPPAGLGGVSHGHPDPSSGYTGTNVYGVNLAGDYSTTMGGPNYLTMGPVDLTGIVGTRLEFMRWLNSDYAPYATNKVEVSANGTNWVEVWSNGSTEYTDSAWVPCVFDIAGIVDGHSDVYVRWSYQIGSGAWAYSGWNIDDVAFTAFGCDYTPPLCAGDLNCDGAVTYADIDPFVAALNYPGGVGWPHECPWLNADCNGDDDVTYADIDAFVARIGATCP